VRGAAETPTAVGALSDWESNERVPGFVANGPGHRGERKVAFDYLLD
jgi:hypothetical protein